MKDLLSDVLNENTSLLEQVFESGNDDDKALVEDLIKIAETEQGYELIKEVVDVFGQDPLIEVNLKHWWENEKMKGKAKNISNYTPHSTNTLIGITVASGILSGVSTAIAGGSAKDIAASTAANAGITGAVMTADDYFARIRSAKKLGIVECEKVYDKKSRMICEEKTLDFVAKKTEEYAKKAHGKTQDRLNVLAGSYKRRAEGLRNQIKNM